jgi:hypothetical protein
MEKPYNFLLLKALDIVYWILKDILREREKGSEGGYEGEATN